ncbi:MAG: F0F1 ATP synthase subunit delta, partial [Aristaeellaceae bacterium]
MTHFAREYGNALFELATEEGIAQEMEQQLQMLASCFREQPEYIALLDARNIEIEKRKALLDEAFSGRVHAYLLNYLKLLTERG